jgi:hypothetical protein
MTSMWDYQKDVGGGADRDFVGYDVEATDGSIGKVDEASNEAGSAYVVVDTGFWIFGKKRMLPASVIDHVDEENRKVYVAMAKDDIKSAPDFNDQDRDIRDLYDTYYEPFGRRP